MPPHSPAQTQQFGQGKGWFGGCWEGPEGRRKLLWLLQNPHGQRKLLLTKPSIKMCYFMNQKPDTPFRECCKVRSCWKMRHLSWLALKVLKKQTLRIFVFGQPRTCFSDRKKIVLFQNCQNSLAPPGLAIPVGSLWGRFSQPWKTNQKIK